ncbi:MAG: phosphate signaling complex protein PhoU [candidate division Zixibacteria bacterium]|nr:phosphate signaling complex protein PhoU [candidate division Zixibacteria bacterium]NIR63090.1 phosphate signaling complex protein PhoU [candidate division Zixibacteria bacterium]NIS16566.1 phosphate signaling complex protein PhoU [candidate division Zixibacteria bacterium]NIS45087.1 phosphate signaling complex protein PhoU [candidate division Zixibacteria bacterium]NIT52642.1 phosphate signaling complex protein PhoU [candidate division Zixibacteria bacterium]
MSVHLQREITNLKKSILSLGAIVEERAWQAVKAVTDRNPDLAKTIIEADLEIDRMEVEIEEDCLKILALHQPVAIDLRFIVAVLKINNDLERIGDLASNIAELAVRMSNLNRIDMPPEFPAITDKTQAMLKNSLDALVNLDDDLAQEVRVDDDEVDHLNRMIYDYVKNNIKKDMSSLDAMIYLRAVSKNLERIADLATNIAEDVIYTCRGEIVRHKTFDDEQ